MDENSKVMGERNSPTLLKPTPHICGILFDLKVIEIYNLSALQIVKD
jgi:hypothetical protein